MEKSKDNLRILLVEDRRFDEDAARLYLGAAGYQSVTTAKTADEARLAIEQGSFDFVIVDPRIPRRPDEADDQIHGLALVDDIKILGIPLILFTISVTREIVVEALKREIGCVRKHDLVNPGLLGKAMDATLAGGVVYSMTSTAIMKTLVPSREKRSDEFGLSVREREVIYLWAVGFHAAEDADQQVANRLHIEKETVGKHRRNAIECLGFHTKAQLAAWVVEQENTFADVKKLHQDLFGNS